MPGAARTERFEIRGQLGRGGMGAVHLAYDRERDLEVALKLLPFVEAPSLLRFKNEFRSLAALTHPHLVPLYELIADGERWFFTMGVVRGCDFQSYVRPEGRLDLERLRRALGGLAAGVGALHAAGLLHRDIKPSNVLVRDDGHVVLLDFGLTVRAGSALTSDASAGTFTYMSPEQGAGEPLGPESDWYSVGVMLFEALTGQLPFSGTLWAVLSAKLARPAPRASTLNPDVPPALDDLCAALLATDPAQRASGAEVVAWGGGDAAAAPAAPPGAALRAPNAGDAPFVGRERQLAALHGALDAVRRGGTACALVHGRSGTGKTTLLEHFLAGLAGVEEVVLLRGRCIAQESVPFKGLDSLVDALSDYLRRLPPGRAEALLPRHVDALAHVFPVLARVDGIAAVRAGGSAADPIELRRRAFAALRELLARIGDRVPVVLVVDDLQWGDVDSALALAQLLQPPDAPRLLMVVSYRSEYERSSRCLETFLMALRDAPADQRVAVEVGALAHDDAARLAAELLRAAGLPEAQAERIARESAGNAFYVAELTRHVARAATPSAAAAGVAPRLDDVLWERVQWLPDDARRLLEAVAVAGRPVPARAAFEAAGLRQLDHGPVLRLRNEHFVRLGGVGLDDEIETYHDRVRETITQRLPEHVLRELHRGFARALETPTEEDPEALAVHLDAGGDFRRAGHCYARAAAAADRALAFDQAASLYLRALERLPEDDPSRPALRVRLADALANAGRVFEAAQAYEAACESAPPEERPELRRKAATQYVVSGQRDRGRAIFAELLRAHGLSIPEGYVQNLGTLLLRSAVIAVRGRRHAERPAEAIPAEALRRIDLLWSVSATVAITDGVAAAAMQSQGLLLALRAGEPGRVARALAWDAFLTSAGGWRAEGLAAERLARAQTLADRLGDPHVLAIAQLARGLVAFTQGRHPEAIREAQLAEEMLAACRGAWWELQMARSIGTLANWHLGAFRELERRATAYINEARQRGDLHTVMTLGSIAPPELAVAADDPARARELTAEMSRMLAPVRGFQINHSAVVFADSHTDLYVGRGAEAHARIRAAWPLLRRELLLAAELVLVMFLDIRARSAIAAAGRAAPSERRALLRAAERDARRMAGRGAPWAGAFAETLLAGVANLRGDADEARRRLTTGAGALEALGFAMRAANARYYLGRLEGGDSGARQREAAEAHMRSELVARPERFVRVRVPGFDAEERDTDW